MYSRECRNRSMHVLYFDMLATKQCVNEQFLFLLLEGARDQAATPDCDSDGCGVKAGQAYRQTLKLTNSVLWSQY